MKSSLSQITGGNVPVLIDFFATWCGPCQTMSPILDQVKEKLGESVKIVKVDIDKNQALATQFQVRGVPTFMIFKDGKPQWRQSGVLSKTDLLEVITKHQD